MKQREEKNEGKWIISSQMSQKYMAAVVIFRRGDT